MLHTAALLCLALMTGNEICVLVFVNPVLRRLSEAQQVPFLTKAASRLGLVLPFWYAASFVLTAATAYQLHRASGVWRNAVTLSAALQMAVLVLTIPFMVPINNRLGKLQPDQTGWTAYAVRWDRMHLLRVLCLLSAVLALSSTLRW